MTTEPKSVYSFLLPDPDEETQPFWDALKRHELVMQRCADCKEWRFPPTKICRACFSENSEWAPLSGRGIIYSYITVHQPVLAAWRNSAPYEIIIVQPEEITVVPVFNNTPDNVFHGNLASGVDPSVLAVGLPVEAVFDDVTDEVTILRWRPR